MKKKETKINCCCCGRALSVNSGPKDGQEVTCTNCHTKNRVDLSGGVVKTTLTPEALTEVW